ncbi:MAG: pyrroline-5-carboxylate reductase [Candidatus Omnitrophica bacterium]|jgi:pyrroline-5-carboxylate reductase|nr:pyrroline-5-carboxylate reductase [Candidatus Omnitrophota bacterium]
MDKMRVGIIGFGNMGQAIAGRIKTNYALSIFEKDKSKIAGLRDIFICSCLSQLSESCEVIILAIKPQDFEPALKDLNSFASGKLFISIAAGITTAYIEKYLPKARLIRVMPNLAATIGEAETCLAKGKYALDNDMHLARRIFDLVGKTWIMPEDLINAATAISGSGPAYIFYDLESRGIDGSHLPEGLIEEYIQRLTEAARSVGFDEQTALELATSTTYSSIHLASCDDPAELRKKVTSKAGTTAAALKILSAGGSWVLAAGAAIKRAEELSR